MVWVKKKLNISSSNIIDYTIPTQTKPEKVSIMVGTFLTEGQKAFKKVASTVVTFLNGESDGFEIIELKTIEISGIQHIILK